MRLEGKVAIVTGGGQGLGEAFCRRFAQEGARVAVVDRNLQSARAVAESIGDAGAESLAVQTDVSEVAQIGVMVERVLDHFGTVDILVNNAGILDVAPLDEITEEVWDRQIDVNLKGQLWCAW